MTLSIRLTGPDPNAAVQSAADLLRDATGCEPEQHELAPGGGPKRDLGTGLAIASLVLSVPGAVLATMDVVDRVQRRRVAARVEALKAQLAASGGDALLEIAGSPPLDLARTPTDAIVDAILRSSRR